MRKKRQKSKRKHDLPENYMCPSNPHNMDCNACGGDVCGQREVSEEEWILRGHLQKQ